MGYSIVIPARYASTRLPGKPLLVLHGKTILQHVYERACNSNAEQIIIATDDARIRENAESFNATVCMTSPAHHSGTERLAEVAEQLGFAGGHIVVNLQGDEPLMPAACIEQVANVLETANEAQMSTLCAAIGSAHELFDPHVVKVVRDAGDFALYFSRAPIPWHRDEYVSTRDILPADGTPYYRHIGLYAYRAGFIKEYINSAASHLEQAEALEQLRVLWHGGRIMVAEATQLPGPGIDTQDDLRRVAEIMAG